MQAVFILFVCWCHAFGENISAFVNL